MFNYLGLIMKVLVLVVMWLMVIFMLWRRFRLDIDEHKIMTFGVWTLIFALWIGFGLRIWIGLTGLLIILGYFSQRYNWDGFEILDAWMPMLSIFIGLASSEWSLLVIAAFGWLVNTNSRRIRWYKSGKPGLTGLAVILGIGVYLVIYGFKTDFADQVAGIWLLTGSLVSIYLRSRIKLLK